MEIQVGRANAKARAIGILAVGIAIALALLDFVVLRGERVDGGSAPLSGERPTVLELVQPGREHLIEITTRRRRHGETKGRSIDYRLEDPDGHVVVQESELVARKKRYVTFEPEVPGEYRLFVEDAGLLGPGSGSADVAVYVGDHRFLRRFAF